MEGQCIGEIGTVVPGSIFTVTGLKGNVVVKADIFELRDVWKKTLAF